MVQIIHGEIYTIQDINTNYPLWELMADRSLSVLHVVYDVVYGINKSQNRSFPNLEFVFCPWDGVISQIKDHPVRNLQEPINPDPIAAFTMIKCTGSMNIPFPVFDIHTEGSIREWNTRIETIKGDSKKYSWKLKKEKAVFRGGFRTCTVNSSDEGIGGIPGVDLGREYPILSNGKIVYKKYPLNECGRARLQNITGLLEDFDVFVNGLPDGFNKEMFNRKDVEQGYLPLPEQEKFKYVIYAEGHGGWSSRLKQQLFMGSAIIKQFTTCNEYFALALKPFVHFIPTGYNFNNISKALTEAKKK